MLKRTAKRKWDVAEVERTREEMIERKSSTDTKYGTAELAPQAAKFILRPAARERLTSKVLAL